MEIVALFIILVFLWLSMFFSGMETGLISIDRLKLEQDAKEDKLKRKLLSFIEEPNRFLGVTLIGNNISIVVVSTIFTVYFARLLPMSQSLSTLLLAGIMLIFAEIIPKSVCRDNANRIVSRSFPLIFFFYLILRPFVSLVNLMYSFLSKFFGLEKDYRFSFLTREELAILLSESELQDTLQQPQKDMLEEVLEFNELNAKNVMTPRTDIVAIRHDTTIPEVIKIAQQEGYTRYPVYDQDIDNIIGILIIYDLIRVPRNNLKHPATGLSEKEDTNSKRDLKNEPLKAADFSREAFFVPETMDLNALLKEMQSKRKSMAVVVDSFGGTAGIVTVEDISEELVGEIEDEYDLETTEEKDVEKVNDNQYIVKGHVEIDFLNDEYDTDLPEGDYETVAGLIIDRLRRIPVKGNSLQVGRWKMEILQATNTKIVVVKMTRKNL